MTDNLDRVRLLRALRQRFAQAQALVRDCDSLLTSHGLAGEESGRFRSVMDELSMKQGATLFSMTEHQETALAALVAILDESPVEDVEWYE